jgi:hypothetical protein
MSEFRKNQKVWLVNMDRTGLFDVVPGVFQEASDSGRTLFVRIDIEYEGKTEKMVVDRRVESVYRTRREAALKAVAMCREVARKNTERADTLLAGLTEKK